MACSRLALPRWSLLAREAGAMRLDALAMQVLATRHAAPRPGPGPTLPPTATPAPTSTPTPTTNPNQVGLGGWGDGAANRRVQALLGRLDGGTALASEQAYVEAVRREFPV